MRSSTKGLGAYEVTYETTLKGEYTLRGVRHAPLEVARLPLGRRRKLARGLVDAKRRGPAAVKSFSFRAFIGDLVPLLFLQQ